jgi:hypothetical protein
MLDHDLIIEHSGLVLVTHNLKETSDNFMIRLFLTEELVESAALVEALVGVQIKLVFWLQHV